MKTIQVEVKQVYGVAKIYPANDAAKTLANIAGTKTLSQHHLNLAKLLGLQIEEVAIKKLGALV